MNDPNLVDTSSGQIQGYELFGARVFRGIPYAQASRFAVPTRPKGWGGTLDTTTYGPTAPQLRAGRQTPVSGALGALLGWPQNEWQSEESCLVANVWTPAAPRDRLLPVFLYIHGGQFVAGSGSWPMYDGTYLAREHDVVVVTFNYRLGLLGLLHADESRATGFGAHPGLLDQIAALRWVSENITAFGGDPANVTVGGSMAGADAVLYLAAVPQARALFRRGFLRAIDSSVVGAQRSPDDVAVTAELAADLIDDGTSDPWKTLFEAPVDQLLWAQGELQRRDRTRGSAAPFIDGTVATRSPIEALASEDCADLALVLGCTREEAQLSYTSWAADVAGGTPTLDQTNHGFSDEVVAAYRSAMPSASDHAILIRMSTDADARLPLRALVAARDSAGVHEGTFMYHFTRPTPMLGLNGAVHAVDVPYWFGTVQHVPLVGDPGAAWPLSRVMAAALASFLHEGEPQLPDVTWPNYDFTSRMTAVLGDVASVESDPDPIPSRARMTS